MYILGCNTVWVKSNNQRSQTKIEHNYAAILPVTGERLPATTSSQRVNESNATSG